MRNYICPAQHFPIRLQKIYASDPHSIWCLIDCCCGVKYPSSLICIPCSGESSLLWVRVGINTEMLLEARSSNKSCNSCYWKTNMPWM